MDPTWTFLFLCLFLLSVPSPTAASFSYIFSRSSPTLPIVTPTFTQRSAEFCRFLFSNLLSFSSSWYNNDPILPGCLFIGGSFLFCFFVLWLLSSSRPSNAILIHQTFPAPSPVFSIFSFKRAPTYDIKDDDWPLFEENGIVPFVEFVTTFKETFAFRKIPQQFKFLCFRHSLSLIDPFIISTTGAFDTESFDDAVLLLSGYLFVSPTDLCARRNKIFSEIAQSPGQTFGHYYTSFQKVATRFSSICDTELLRLFYFYLDNAHQEHLKAFYANAWDRRDSFTTFFKSGFHFLAANPLPHVVTPVVNVPQRPPAVNLPRAPPTDFLPCIHCRRNHLSERCYRTFPHLRPPQHNPPTPPARPPPAQSPPVIASISVESPSPRHFPTFTVPFAGKNTEVLIDTGAQVSCISANLFETAKLSPSLIPNSRQAIVTATGDVEHTLGAIQLLLLGSVSTFHVLKTLFTPIIIGWDILDSFHFNIFNNGFSLSPPSQLPDIDTSHIRVLPLSPVLNNRATIPFTSTSSLPLRPLRRILALTPFNPTPLIDRLLEANSDIFAPNPSAPPKSHLTEFVIETGNAFPIQFRGYPASPGTKAIVDRHIDSMLADGIISPSFSPWCSPVKIVGKKDGSERFCIDYSRVNAVTVQDAYPIPRIDLLLSALGGASFYSSLDMAAAYWQIPIEATTALKLAFVCHRGLFQWNRMPFGSSTAPATLQRTLNSVFAPLLYKCVILYFDDIVIYSSSFAQHLVDLQTVFDLLRASGFSLKRSKCHFLKKELKVLGFVVSSAGISTDPEKVEAITNYPTPSKPKDVLSFLGMAGQYRSFIPAFSSIASPLYALSRKNTPFVWSDQCEAAFRRLKKRLSSTPVLAHPDFTRPFHIFSDAANTKGLGAVICQYDDDDQNHPIAYASRSLLQAESNYTVTELEALAIVWALKKKFHHYVYGTHFHIHTDHANLRYFTTMTDAEGRIGRWILFLQKYQFTVHYIPGPRNIVADALSRHPLPVVAQISAFDSLFLPYNVVAIRDDNHIIAEQAKDPFCSSILNDIQNKPSYILIRGILNRVSLPPHNVHRPLFQIVLPPIFRPFAFFLAHDIPMSGHLGSSKAVFRVKSQYWWPTLEADTKSYVRSCTVCQEYKANQQHAITFRPTTSDTPFARVAMDFFGPLPTSSSGYQYVLVIQDMFTRFVNLIPLQSTTSDEFIKALSQKYFPIHGIPLEFVSDNGPPFGSSFAQIFASTFGVNIRYAPAYRPQSNGLVERFMATLRNMITAFLDIPVTASTSKTTAQEQALIKERQSNWDSLLPQIAFAYNTSFHSTIHDTPFFLAHGRDPRHPLNLVSSYDLASIPLKTSHPYPALHKFFSSLIDARTAVAVNQELAAPVPSIPSAWPVGMAVWLYTPPTTSGLVKAKFRKTWSGPCRISSIRSHDIRDLVDPQQRPLPRIHISRLKPFYTRDGLTPEPTLAPPVDPASVPLPEPDLDTDL